MSLLTAECDVNIFSSRVCNRGTRSCENPRHHFHFHFTTQPTRTKKGSAPMAFQPLDLNSIFTFHPATPDTGPAHEQVRSACLEAAEMIINLTPGCPEQTLAIRAVQEAMMWANSAIAQFGVPQPPKPALGHHGADG